MSFVHHSLWLSFYLVLLSSGLIELLYPFPSRRTHPSSENKTLVLNIEQLAKGQSRSMIRSLSILVSFNTISLLNSKASALIALFRISHHRLLMFAPANLRWTNLLTRSLKAWRAEKEFRF